MSTKVANKLNSPKETGEAIPPTNHLFKPLVVNQRMIRHSESDITTTSTTLPLSSVNNDSNIPLIYPQFQLGVIPPLKNNRPINPAFIYHQENINKKILDMKTKPCCSCNKTKCIKKYCECFANNKLCTNCLCIDCRNKDIFINTFGMDNSDKNKNKEIIVCTCSKSGCNKKYCECYKEGLKCNIKCRCINCLNLPEELNNKNSTNEKIISLDESKSESGKNTTSTTKGEVDGFNIQRISILINKNQTLINVEKLDKDEFNLLCKKRNKC